jgi:methionyl-tRNA synthetase
LAPYLPFTSAHLADVLGIELDGWYRQPVPAGRKLPWSGPLFTKLDTHALDPTPATAGKPSA